MVQLPAVFECAGGTLVSWNGLGELSPNDWQRLLPFEQSVPEPLRIGSRLAWAGLQKENASPRAIVGGRLVSVPTDFYDFLIVREIEQQQEVFHEAVLIGRLLGRHPIGWTDAWIAKRLAIMIDRGWLRLEDTAPADSPACHRTLRRLPAFETRFPASAK